MSCYADFQVASRYHTDKLPDAKCNIDFFQELVLDNWLPFYLSFLLNYSLLTDTLSFYFVFSHSGNYSLQLVFQDQWIFVQI